MSSTLILICSGSEKKKGEARRISRIKIKRKELIKLEKQLPGRIRRIIPQKKMVTAF